MIAPADRLKCIIVDDDAIARKGMFRLVASRNELELSGVFDSASAASAFIAVNRVDLVFLDIQMSDVNGIEFARGIPRDTLVVFTTAYSEYAMDGYEVEAVDYLLKPISPERFGKAVDKALAYHRFLLRAADTVIGNCRDEGGCIEKAKSDQGVIIVKSDRRFVRVRLSDIFFIEGLKDYVVIQLSDRRIISRMTVKRIAELLPESIFVRINKSYIINRDKVDSFDNNDVFIGDYELAIGASYRDCVLSTLMK